MSNRTIIIMLLLFVLLVGCTNNDKIVDEGLNNSQSDKKLTEYNNMLEIETKNSNPKKVENVDLLKYEFLGNLINGEKLYFKSKGFYLKQEHGESIIIKSENSNLLISEGAPSRPKINPEGNKICFIDNIGFEVRGDLNVYEVESQMLQVM